MKWTGGCIERPRIDHHCATAAGRHHSQFRETNVIADADTQSVANVRAVDQRDGTPTSKEFTFLESKGLMREDEGENSEHAL